MKKFLPQAVWPVLFVLWIFFVIGSFFVVQKPFATENVLAFSRALLDVAVAGWLGLIGLSLGQLLLRHALRLELGRLEQLVLGSALGLGCLGLISFALGLAGLFQPIVMWVLTAAGTLAIIPALRKNIDRWRHWPNLPPPPPLAALFLGLMGLFTLAVALLPPTDWDGLFYHLTGPKLYLTAGGIVGGVDLPHLSFPGLMEMLFAWAMLLRGGVSSGDIAAKLLHTLFVPLLAGLIFLIAYRFFSKKAGWPAVVVLASMPMIVTLGSWAYNDLALAFYQLAALYVLLRWRLASRTWTLVSDLQTTPPTLWAWLVLSGAFAGFAMGLKYTSFITPLIITIFIAYFSLQNLRTTHYALRTTFVNLLVFSLTALLVASPWYLKNWVFTGNPVYPFLFDVFGGPFWNEFRAAWYAAAGTGIGFEPTTLLTLPWLLTLGVRDVNYWDGRTGPLLLVFLPGMVAAGIILSRRRRKANGLSLAEIRQASVLTPLLLYALAHFVVWTLGVIWSRSLWQSRLLLPGLVALAPVAGWLWTELPRFDLNSFSISRFATVAIGLTLTLTVIDVGLLTLKINPLPYLTGLETRNAYLERRLGAHYVTMEQLNQTLPPNAVVVFLWEPRSYYCRQDCRPDSILDTFPNLVHQHHSAEAIAQVWREAGVSHVLIHRAGLEFVLNESPADVDQAVLAEIESRYLQQLFEVGDSYQVYALQGAP